MGCLRLGLGAITNQVSAGKGTSLLASSPEVCISSCWTTSSTTMLRTLILTWARPACRQLLLSLWETELLPLKMGNP